MAETTETLKEYEELFPHRFTSEDPEYQQYKSRPADPPPMVEDWRSRGGNHRGGRDRDRRGGRGWGGGGGWGGDRGWRGDHRGQQNWHDRDRDRDRHSGHGSGYHSGPPNSYQGYNSHHQRPHYDRY